jgi:hypothetical protein
VTKAYVKYTQQSIRDLGVIILNKTCGKKSLENIPQAKILRGQNA